LETGDLYHARQHLWKIAALLHPQDPIAKRLWMIPMKDLLDAGSIETLVTHLREIAVAHADVWRRALRDLPSNQRDGWL
jgi:hypothetical protein